MNTLKAEKRSMDVKAKKLRREGFVTGNMFGKEIKESIPVKMQKKDVDQLLKTDNKGSQIMLEIDGQPYNVLIKDVEYNSMSRMIEEIDFQALVSDQKVHSVAEVILLNHDKVVGGVIQENLSEISYKALPAALVDKVKIDVSTMHVGDVIHVKDLDIAIDKDIDLVTNPDAVVVMMNAVHSAAAQEDTEETEEK